MSDIDTEEKPPRLLKDSKACQEGYERADMRQLRLGRHEATANSGE
jgi:hypothetical protein